MNKEIKIKICGMKYADNIAKISEFKPDYLGFIFYEKSPRNFHETKIPPVDSSIRKVGVFVDAEINFVLSKAKKYNLDFIQLHGNESPKYCESIQNQKLKLIKAFSVDDEFDFSILEEFSAVDYFLFDAKGKLRGGNSFSFDWNKLEEYNYEKPFFISGGIGLDKISDLKKLLNSSLPVCGVDLNSKLEDKPGFKNVEKTKEIIRILRSAQSDML